MQNPHYTHNRYKRADQMHTATATAAAAATAIAAVAAAATAIAAAAAAYVSTDYNKIEGEWNHG